jgi:hypothetical protein
MSTFPGPHERIAALSRNGSPLALRLRSARKVRGGHVWVRVHENGELEQADGDARSETVIKPLVAVGRADSRTLHATEIRDHLLRRLWRRDLSRPPPWDKYYPVQAFEGTEKVIEGYIGVEVEMGTITDIFGIDGDHACARAILDGITELLGFLPPE